MRMKSEDLQGMSPFCRSMSEANILGVMVMMMMMVLITKKRVTMNITMKKHDRGSLYEGVRGLLLGKRKSKTRENLMRRECWEGNTAKKSERREDLSEEYKENLIK